MGEGDGGFSFSDLLGNATGFLGDLAGSVVRVEEARAARSLAKQNTGGGYAVAPSGDLVKNSTQQTVTPTASALPQSVWIVGGLGLALLVLVLVLRR